MNISQRDVFWNRIFELAKNDRRVVVVAADMGAPALDKFRLELPGQFVNTGIAEQNTIGIAAGLARQGKIPFAYAIAPFITMRCLEQTRVNSGIMDIPINIVGVGAGFSYEESGPTHHTIEDVAMLRSMPNIVIHNVVDGIHAKYVADVSVARKKTNYIRLDRRALPEIHGSGDDFSSGFSVFGSGDVAIVGTGIMSSKAIAISKALSKNGVKCMAIDLHTIPFDEKAFVKKLSSVKALVSIEEHFLNGGMGSAILETLSDAGLLIPVKRLGLTHAKAYSYVYGGTDEIHKSCGLDQASLLKQIKSFIASA